MERMGAPHFCRTPVWLTLLWGILWGWMRRPLRLQPCRVGAPSRADGAEHVRAPPWCQPSPGGLRGEWGGGHPGGAGRRQGQIWGRGAAAVLWPLQYFHYSYGPSGHQPWVRVLPNPKWTPAPPLSLLGHALSPLPVHALSLKSMHPASVSPPGSGALPAVGGDPTRVLSHGPGLLRDPDPETHACNAMGTRCPEVLTCLPLQARVSLATNLPSLITAFGGLTVSTTRVLAAWRQCGLDPGPRGHPGAAATAVTAAHEASSGRAPWPAYLLVTERSRQAKRVRLSAPCGRWLLCGWGWAPCRKVPERPRGRTEASPVRERPARPP